MFDLKVKGARKLNAKLNRMQKGAARKAVRPAMHEALAPVVSAAKDYAPTGDSGRLKKFIKSFVKNSRRSGINGYIVTGTRKQLRIPADAKYYYPAAIEYGTRFISPRSFLRRAMGSKRSQALKILGTGIAERLRRL